MDEHPNCQAIETFLNQLGDGISRPICSTEQINGAKVSNGYTASYWNADTGQGFTVIAWGNGNFKLIMESAGHISRAADDGAMVMRALEIKSS